MSLGSDFQSGAAGASTMDKDLQRFIEETNTKQRFQQLVSELNEKCWDICVDKPGQRLDGKTESCITNCVNRYIDVSTFIVRRVEKMGPSHEMEFS